MLPAAVASAVGLGTLHVGVHGLLEVFGAGILIVGTYVLTFFFTGMSHQERKAVRQLVQDRLAAQGE